MLPLSFEEIYILFLQISDRILHIYNAEEIYSKKKIDKSLVTEADIISNSLLSSFLNKYSIPIISEESRINEKKGRLEWIIDPLDGTVDFIQKTGEFSILVGLSFDGKPIQGYIFLPIIKKMYFAEIEKGAFVFDGLKKKKINVSKRTNSNMIITVSRNHPNSKQSLINKKLGISKKKTSGSLGIKMAMIAEGTADIYIHSQDKISIWDTCAGEIILKEAGGLVTDANGEALMYNRKNLKHKNGVIASNGIDHAEIIKVLSK